MSSSYLGEQSRSTASKYSDAAGQHPNSGRSTRMQRLLLPTYHALLYEIACVQAAREKLLERMATSSPLANSDADDIKPWDNLGAFLDAPRQWMPISRIWRLSTPTPKLLKSRKRYIRSVHSIIAALDTLHTRVRESAANDVQTNEPSQTCLRQLDAYELAMHWVAVRIAPMRPSTGRGSAVHRAAISLREASSDLVVLTRLSAQLIAQFDADVYLAASPDIVSAINRGECYSALEHFVRQGAFEALQGGRVRAGVDLAE